jgi:hypothetical protein
MHAAASAAMLDAARVAAYDDGHAALMYIYL